MANPTYEHFIQQLQPHVIECFRQSPLRRARVDQIKRGKSGYWLQIPAPSYSSCFFALGLRTGLGNESPHIRTEFVIGRGGSAGPAWNDQVFRALQSSMGAKKCGTEMFWQNKNVNGGPLVKRVIFFGHSWAHDESKWPDLNDWLCTQLRKLHDCLPPMLPVK